MERLEPIPALVKRALALHEVWPAEIQLAASGDLSFDGEYCGVWVIVCKERCIVLTGQSLVNNRESGKQGPAAKDRKEPEAWQEKSFAVYAMKDIEEIKAENLTSTGMLTVKLQGKDTVLCRYSNSYVRKFALLAKLAGKLKQGEELKEEDFKEEQSPAYCPKCGLMYSDPARRICPRCLDKRAIFIRVLSFLPRYKIQLSIILISMFLSAALNLLNPYIGGNIFFDQVLNESGKYFGRILQIVLLMVSIRLLALGISIIYGRVNAGITAQVIFDLKTEVFSSMQRLSLSFYNNSQTGSLMTRVNNDAMQLQYFFHDGFPYFIVNAITIVGIGVTMMLVDWKLAVMVLIPTPVIVYFLRKIFPKLWMLFSRRFQKTRSINALINDTLTGMRVVKAFGRENSEINRFSTANDGVCSVNMDLGRMTSTVFPLVEFVMGIGGLIVWGAGGWQVAKGNMTFGTLITFTGYISMIYGPLQFMTQMVQWWSSCMNSAERIFEILDAVPDVTNIPDPIRIPSIKGNVVMDKVTFSYEVNTPVLHNICLEVKAGEMIGLVGHSGAGKSTITNLITRLYDVDEGTIFIDGTDIKKIALEDLRSQIGMVLQDTFLFTGTIAENITYARPEASMDEIIQAAKAANAHDFIMKLPDGYDTIIGKKGKDLSGGEKQRLSIARAILHDPRILILDEATSSVDTETERQIQEALERLVKGRTTFAIAHRLSTLRNADRLVVMEDGKIAELGTHSELVKMKGVYFKLLEKQREALKIQGVGE